MWTSCATCACRWGGRCPPHHITSQHIVRDLQVGGDDVGHITLRLDGRGASSSGEAIAADTTVLGAGITAGAVLSATMSSATSPTAPVCSCHGTAAPSAAEWVVSELNEAGETALHVACWTGNAGAAAALLGAGADANTPDTTSVMARPLHEVRAVWLTCVCLART